MRTRLTLEQRIQRATKEIDFQRQLVGPTGLATMLGWVHVHFRPAMTKHGWRTAGTGELAAGWPDLVLLRVRDHRLIFAELKRELERPSIEQAGVLAALGAVAWNDQVPANRTPMPGPRIEVFIWRPSDLERIVEILR